MNPSSREHLLREPWDERSDTLQSQDSYSRKSFDSYHSGYQADESNDFENISLLDNTDKNSNAERYKRRSTEPNWVHQTRSKQVPEFFWGLQLDTVIIALVTVVRVALGAIVESSISQGAWIWVSEASLRRSDHHARLDDFKLFDEASRGLWGSICLIWRMKFRHMACIGAAIVVLVHGFETFSQQMVIFEERPRMAGNATQVPAPAPPRSEIWDYYVRRGFTGAVVPALSTRAAVYSGIIATELAPLTPTCYTANCSWPIIPTLGACGECTSVPVTSSCNATSHICTYSTPSGTSVDLPSNPGDQGVSRVAPSNGTHNHLIDSASRAYFSVFDILTATATSGSVNTTANECALWFCVQAYRLSVSEGQTTSSLLATWPTTQFESATSTHPARYRFVDIPASFNVQLPSATYAVTSDALSVLRDFTAGLTSGTVFINANVLDYSSDWIEAMWNASTADLDSWMSTFALSMSNEIRQQGKADYSRGNHYNGFATEMAPFIRVQWLWMVYPALLIAGSLWFLSHTILRGAHDGVSVWKSDALPMLFCRVDNGIHDRVKDGMDVPNGLGERVGHTRVALYRGERGEWTFRTVRDGEE